MQHPASRLGERASSGSQSRLQGCDTLDKRLDEVVFHDLISGTLVLVFGTLSLSSHFAWARVVTASVGVWLLFAPLVFWAPTAAGYLNDTLVGALVIGFSMLVPPTPGVGVAARMTGPDVPPGWDYTPSGWTQRIPIIALAFVGLAISRYLAAYQLGHTESAWDPFFGEGTERIITSEVSKACADIAKRSLAPAETAPAK